MQFKLLGQGLEFSIIKKAFLYVALSCANIFSFTCNFIRLLSSTRTGIGCYALSTGFLISWNKFTDSFVKAEIQIYSN